MKKLSLLVLILAIGCISFAADSPPSATISVTTLAAALPPSVTLTASATNPIGAFWVTAAVANIPTVAHVDFWVDNALYHRENAPLYSLFGAGGGVPNTGTLTAGSHVVTALVYTNETALLITSAPLTIIEGTPPPTTYAPSAPTVAICGTSSSTICISITPGATTPTNSAPVGHRLYRQAPPATNWTMIVAITNSAAVTYTDTGLPPSTTFNYQVIDWN